MSQREALIRDHWKRWRDRAEKPLRDTGMFRVHVQRPAKIGRPTADSGPLEPPLEFRLEHGWYEGKQATRVVCEGIQLEVRKFFTTHKPGSATGREMK